MILTKDQKFDVMICTKDTKIDEKDQEIRDLNRSNMDLMIKLAEIQSSKRSLDDTKEDMIFKRHRQA